MDPVDWTVFRRQAHELLEDLLSHIEERPERDVWTEPPPSDSAAELFPEIGEGLEGIRERLRTEILPYDLGNLHPRFFGWIHGAGTPGAILAAAAEAALNTNAGGRDHVGTRLEHQVLRWFAGQFGFPDVASGILTTGTSLANVIALAVAREQAFPGIREAGPTALTGRPRIYVSEEGHLSIPKAAELLGLGRNAVVPVAVDDELRMRPDALLDELRRAHAAGDRSVAVVASLGTASTGSIDPLEAIADIAREFGVWLHTDAAFGGLVVLSDELRPLAAGVERSDSIAFDFHKWMHVPYSAGCVLVRDPDRHLAAFGGRPGYLRGAEHGPAGAPVRWPMELGPELSRGFRALRVWWPLIEHGRKGVAEQVERSVTLADELADLVEAGDSFQLLHRPDLQIVVFRALGGRTEEGEIDELNRELVRRLQRDGVVLPSETTVRGRVGIRIAITNHRTTAEDLRILMSAIEREVETIDQ